MKKYDEVKMDDLIADILIQFSYDYKVEANGAFSNAHDKINDLIDNEQKSLVRRTMLSIVDRNSFDKIESLKKELGQSMSQIINNLIILGLTFYVDKDNCYEHS